MIRWRISLVLLCVLGLTSVARAQASPSQAKPQNIVTVSFNTAVLQTAEAQKSLSALQVRYAPKQKQLQALNDEVESLRKQLADTSSNLSDSERASPRAVTGKQGEATSARSGGLQDGFAKRIGASFSTSRTEGLRFSADLLAAARLFSGDRAWIRCDIRLFGTQRQHGHYDELIKAYNSQAEAAPAAPANGPAHGTHRNRSKSLPDNPSPN